MTGQEVYNAWAGSETIEANIGGWRQAKITSFHVRDVDPLLYEIEVKGIDSNVRLTLEVGENTDQLRARRKEAL